MSTGKLVSVVVRMGKTVHYAAPDGVATVAGPGEQLELPEEEASRLIAGGAVVIPDDEAAAFHRGHATGEVLPPVDPAPPPDPTDTGIRRTDREAPPMAGRKFRPR